MKTSPIQRVGLIPFDGMACQCGGLTWTRRDLPGLPS